MDVRIDPEPSPEERAAILAALAEVTPAEIGTPSAWAQADLDDEPGG